jgi:hypothetical protein
MVIIRAFRTMLLVITLKRSVSEALGDMATGVPTVAVESSEGTVDLPVVCVDQEKGAGPATDHLLGLGHRGVRRERRDGPRPADGLPRSRRARTSSVASMMRLLGPPAIRASNTGEVRAEEGPGLALVATRGNAKDGGPPDESAPQSALVAPSAPAGLIDVDRRSGADEVEQFFVGQTQRRRCAPENGIDRAGAQMGAKELAHQFDGVAAGDAVDAGRVLGPKRGGGVARLSVI